MTRSDDDQTILIQADGRILASAEIHPTIEPGVVHSDLHVASGHLPGGTRSRLVDAVLDAPEVEQADRLLATMPLGDTEMVDRVRERSADVELRAAGATKLADVRLPHEE